MFFIFASIHKTYLSLWRIRATVRNKEYSGKIFGRQKSDNFCKKNYTVLLYKSQTMAEFIFIDESTIL